MNTSSNISNVSRNEPVISGFTYRIQRGNSFNGTEENPVHQPYASLNDSFPYHRSSIKNRSYSCRESTSSITSFENNNNKNKNDSCNETVENSGKGIIKEALRKFQNSHPDCLKTNDTKYIGKIKLIPQEHEHSPPTKVGRSRSVDLEEEFSYRKETSLTDAFLMFKQAETDHKKREKIEKEEAKKKRFQRQVTDCLDRKGKSTFPEGITEKEKLQKIHELEKEIMQGNTEDFIDGEPEPLKRERKMNVEAERAFLRQVCKPNNKDVLKRWNHADTSSTLAVQKYSDDSGMVEEEDNSAFEPDSSQHDLEKQRKDLDLTEEAFRQFTFKHKVAPKFQTEVSLKPRLSDTNSSKSDSFSYIQSPMESTLNEKTLNERLETAEKQVLKFQEMKKKFAKDGRRAEALEAEEGYHAACLTISRIRKRLFQIQNDTSLKTQRKHSRECKMPSKTHQPPVDIENYNDEGECVPEGIIQHRLKTFQKSGKQFYKQAVRN